MSNKAKLLAVALAAVATVAAVKLVPTHRTDAPYATAFRVAPANALASCPPRRCVPNPARCVSIGQGGCNLQIVGGQAVCGPVEICSIDPEYVE